MFGRRSEWTNIDGKGNDIREYLEHDEQGWFCKSNTNRNCVFLNNNKLCNIQLRYNEKALPINCRVYPRLIGRYSERIEFGMDHCCPVVAYSVKDWTIGTFLTEGRLPRIDDEKYLKREEVLSILSDENSDLIDCLGRIADLYDCAKVIPDIRLEGEKEVFLRRVTALSLWSSVLYYDGIPMLGNYIEVMLNAAANSCYQIASRDYSSWMDMSVDYSRFIIEQYGDRGLNLDYDKHYLDNKDM